MDTVFVLFLTMWKDLNILICLIFLEQCVLTSNFLFSGEKQLMLVPSVAFRYHSKEIQPTINAHSSDDWILYIQGYF
jgi:hypothetical protein